MFDTYPKKKEKIIDASLRLCLFSIKEFLVITNILQQILLSRPDQSENEYQQLQKCQPRYPVTGVLAQQPQPT
jgi:hypothetical protein